LLHGRFEAELFCRHGAALARIGERGTELDLQDAGTITRYVRRDAEIERF
jgi:hypothetical protein